MANWGTVSSIPRHQGGSSNRIADAFQKGRERGMNNIMGQQQIQENEMKLEERRRGMMDEQEKRQEEEQAWIAGEYKRKEAERIDKETLDAYREISGDQTLTTAEKQKKIADYLTSRARTLEEAKKIQADYEKSLKNIEKAERDMIDFNQKYDEGKQRLQKGSVEIKEKQADIKKKEAETKKIDAETKAKLAELQKKKSNYKPDGDMIDSIKEEMDGDEWEAFSDSDKLALAKQIDMRAFELEEEGLDGVTAIDQAKTEVLEKHVGQGEDEWFGLKEGKKVKKTSQKKEYEKGQVVTANGKSYKIVGFYEDGEPKVVEIKE